MPREHVFIYRIGELGDTLVSLPAIQAIAARHPGALFTLITNPSSQASHINAWHVLQHTGVFAGVMYLAPELRRLSDLIIHIRLRRGAILYYLAPDRTERQLRRDRFVFRWLAGIKTIRGMSGLQAFAGPPRSTDGQLRTLPRESERLLRAVDFSPGDVPPGPQLQPPAAAQTKATRLLGPLVGGPLLGVGPGSKMPAKRWFIERFIEVLQRACDDQQNLGVAILGGPEDASLGAQICAALPTSRAVNLAGQTNIIESAAALAHCTAYLGNDTGTMHLAAAMGTPCVAMFTSRDSPGVWEPWGAGHQILRRDLRCSGCMLEVCTEQQMRCLDLITVEDAWSALAAVLAKGPPARTVARKESAP